MVRASTNNQHRHFINFVDEIPIITELFLGIPYDIGQNNYKSKKKMLLETIRDGINQY